MTHHHVELEIDDPYDATTDVLLDAIRSLLKCSLHVGIPGSSIGTTGYEPRKRT